MIILSNEDKRYLDGLELDNMMYEISNNCIHIRNENTCFIHLNRCVMLNQNEILELYSKVIKLCRKNKIKISYTNNYRKEIINSWNEYKQMVNEYNLLFDEVLFRAKEIKLRGLHYGTSNDIYLNKTYDIIHRMDVYKYRNSVISKISEIFRTLKNLHLELLQVDRIDGYGLTKVFL